MADWFDFKGIRSTSLGVYVQDFPPSTIPEERAKFEPIPGRSGDLTLLEGDAVYNDIVLSVDCFVRDLTNLDAIATWLRGAGNLVLGNAPTRYYKARCVNQIELTNILRGRQHRRFPAVFRCAPYRYYHPQISDLTFVPLTNLVSNPDFATGSTSWYGTNATISAAGGEGVMLASATDGRVSIALPGGSIVGHKYYEAAIVRSTSNQVRLYLAGAIVNHSGSGLNERLSCVGTASSTGQTPNVQDHRSSGWDNVYIDKVVCIDLTATFGAGNEPTAAAMDAYLSARYTDGFFAGTATSGYVNNFGTADACPLITVIGSGDIDLSIGGRTIHIEGLASQITIDTDTGMALDGAGNELTNTVSMDYHPWVIPPGISAVSWTGTVTSLTITRPWRYI